MQECIVDMSKWKLQNRLLFLLTILGKNKEARHIVYNAGLPFPYLMRFKYCFGPYGLRFWEVLPQDRS